MAADEPDWRPAVSASDRFENIQNIKNALEGANHEVAATAQSEAFALENQAFRDSASRKQYEDACRLVRDVAPPLAESADSGEDHPSEVGIAIGPYENCMPVAEGVTSEVFRCKDRALKVIVETRNIEPHNPQREAKILALLKRPCIPLLETFRDHEQRFVLAFPYMPLTLADVLEQEPLPVNRLRSIFTDVFTALRDIHAQGIIHRDIKPAAILLQNPGGPALLSDFGTAWHPNMSIISEPADNKILDIGTGPYRAPECLFGDKSYGTGVDIWATGAMLAEACRYPPIPLFESRPTHEDGNQLGLILSIFKTLGTPTKETWPEATTYKTPPFEMYRTIEGKAWKDILPDIDPGIRDLVANIVRFDSRRMTAEEVRILLPTFILLMV
ncbi:Serine/threonine-protein kinase csk1 like [Verticillium longisporum]|uniref:cyclin-dependent kinase n=1 Tax=Verticillium longisporum TaxID=100787 RepID=A0A8I2ZE75_VERLO|nr:Serine/threonine-protein kinase csk1 like [Verticillium longisporum]